jgi:hypothetical protein
MSAKEIEITCPCCQSRLSVDVLTAKVMRHEAGDTSAKHDTWASAQEKVRGRTASGTSKLDQALESERGKADRLDDLFRKAKDKLNKPETD